MHIDNNRCLLSMLNTTLGEIKYNDDDTYRHCISQIFQIPETEIDDFSFEPGFDYIYDKTSDNAFFKQCYVTAAGFMLSEDPKLGVCVLFAYDYAAAFYDVLCEFFNESNVDDFSAKRQTLHTLLVRKRCT